MKRSRSIRLVLIGGLATGMAAGCGRSPQAATPLGSGETYTNDFPVPGVGFYHAPYRAWYPLPYNHYDATLRQYFHGGQWTPEPHASITNLSAPTADAVRAAQAARSDVPRGGFGGTSRRHSSFFG